VAYWAYCAVAAAVGLVVVAVGVAVMAPSSPCCSAKAADANAKTITAVTANRSTIFFMSHPFRKSASHQGHASFSFFPFSAIMDVCALCVKRTFENSYQAKFAEFPFPDVG
jgi:hypothetical protein